MVLNQKNSRFICGLLLLITLIDCGFYLDRVGFHQADSDESIMWLAAKDMSEGRFFTPAFYGQQYNTHVEALLAAPFIALGAFTPTVVKLSTVFLAYLPFLLFGVLAFRRKQFSAAMIWFIYPTLLPMEWQMMAGASRGFTPGITLSACGMALLLYGSNQARYAAYSLLAVGLAANMNALVFIIPTIIYFWYEHRPSFKSELLFTLPAVLIFIGYSYWNHQFHEANPMYDLHQLWALEWNWKFWVESFSNFRHYFKGLFPWFYEGGVIWILIYVYLGIYHFRKGRWGLFFGQVGLLIFLLIVLGTSKLTDGTGSVYFPYSRFFLGLAYVLPWTLVRTIPDLKKINWKLVSILLVLSTGFKWISYQDRLNFNVKTNTGRVVVSRIDDVCQACSELTQLAGKRELLIFHSKADFYNYGCRALDYPFSTVHPPYERRYWEFESLMTKKRKDVIALDWFEELPGELPDSMIKRMDTPYPAYLISMDSSSILSLYKTHHLPLRPHDIKNSK